MPRMTVPPAQTQGPIFDPHSIAAVSREKRRQGKEDCDRVTPGMYRFRPERIRRCGHCVRQSEYDKVPVVLIVID